MNMAIVYCIRKNEFSTEDIEDLLTNIDVTRVSLKTADKAKGGDVFVYNSCSDSTKKGKIRKVIL